MSNYTTFSLAVAMVPKLGEIPTLTSLAIAQHITNVEAQIDARLSRRYTVPIGSGVGSVPLLTAIATDLTCYTILSRRVFTQERKAESEWLDRFLDSASLLALIAEGEIAITTDSGDVITGRTDVDEVWSSTSGYIPTFAELPPWELPIDPPKIEDLEDEREGR